VLLAPAEFEHGGALVRGGAATEDLDPGQVVVRLPADVSLNPDASPLSAFFASGGGPQALLDQNEAGAPGFLRLVASLAVEERLGSSSAWRDYIRHLPSAQDFRAFHPVFASEELTRRFSGLPLTAHIGQLHAWLQEDWNRWQAFLKKAPYHAEGDVAERWRAAAAVTHEDFSWAFAVVLTRGFGGSEGVMLPTELYPVADDVNTDAAWQQNAIWRRRRDGSGAVALELVATRPVRAGEELLMEYAAPGEDDDDFTI
jgi:hypothetical protein